MNAIPLTSHLDHGEYTTREVYSVQDVRVTLDPNRGWQCACKSYAQEVECSHIAQARVFKSMRGAKRDDDTIELVLNAEELRALYIAGSAEDTDFRRVEPAFIPKAPPRHSRWATVFAAAGIAALSSGITYFATVREQQPVRVAEHHALPTLVATAAPEPRSAPPVRFVNPFDATEVFEFAPGVSESEAREAVAEVLLSRARERLANADAKRRGGNASHRGKAASAARLVNRS